MFCAECGLEIEGKSKKVKGENYCDSCRERRSRRTTAIQSSREETEAASFSTYSGAKSAPGVHTDHLAPTLSSTTSSRANPFPNEETYASHVNMIRKRFLFSKVYVIIPALFVILFLAPIKASLTILPLFIIVFVITVLIMYLKYFSYQPSIDQLVIVEGTIKRRVFKSRNDDRSYRLTDLKGISNPELLKENKKGEINLRGIRKQVAPYVDQKITYYIDAKLEMILICRP